MSVQEIFVKEDAFVFETVMRVRSSEIHIGQYLSLASLTGILDEARSRFFYSKHVKEVDENYQGLVLVDLVVNFTARVRAREELLIEVGVPEIDENQATIQIKVSRMNDQSPVAKAIATAVNYDYRKNEVVAISPKIIQLLEQKPFEI